MAAGRVCTGFSKPYVARYTDGGGGTVTYSDCQLLARGVDVSIEPEVGSENRFYADNSTAESAPGIFTKGTLSLTVDGLLATTERFIMGLPEPRSITIGETTANVYGYGDDINIPYVGVGYVTRYQSDDIVTYVPTVLTKARFNTFNSAAATQEEEIDWQTQALSANLMRDDTVKHEWKIVGEDVASEAEAEAIVKALLGGI